MKERGWQNIIILFKLIIHSKIKIKDLANKTLQKSMPVGEWCKTLCS